MPFPNYKNRFEVQSHIAGPTLRTLVTQVEEKLIKDPTLSPTAVTDTLDIPPLSKYQFYNRSAKVFIDTDLEESVFIAIHSQLTDRIIEQVPQDKDGKLMSADTLEGIAFFSQLKNNFKAAYRDSIQDGEKMKLDGGGPADTPSP